MIFLKTGLVLEGGGMRGIYTAGVLDVFMEHGICFDGVIGVSAGAIHGCSFVSNQKGRSIRYYKKYCGDWRFMSIRSWMLTGDIVGEKFCYHDIPKKLDPYDYETFDKSKTEFFAVCTDIETGKPEYIHVKDMDEQIDAVRASASLPYFSKPVKIGGRKYLDGGCSDSIPIEAFAEMGFSRNVVILTRAKGYLKKSRAGAAAKRYYRKFPQFAEALCNRHIKYNETLEKIEKLEKEGRIFVIRPESPPKIGRLEKNPEKVETLYNMGRKNAEECIEKLESWLSAEKQA